MRKWSQMFSQVAEICLQVLGPESSVLLSGSPLKVWLLPSGSSMLLGDSAMAQSPTFVLRRGDFWVLYLWMGRPLLLYPVPSLPSYLHSS